MAVRRNFLCNPWETQNIMSLVFQLEQRQEIGLYCSQMNSESFNGNRTVPEVELLQVMELRNCYHQIDYFTFFLPRNINKLLAVAKKIRTVKRNLLK